MLPLEDIRSSHAHSVRTSHLTVVERRFFAPSVLTLQF